MVAYIARGYRMTLGRRIRIVAVVGSVGKTTTMRTISATLDRPVHLLALLNANSHAAVGRALLRQRPWQRHAVLEVAISAPDQMHIQAATVRPDIVVVTAIASDHWQSFHTLDATRDEKARIVRSLPAGGIAVLNADDENVRWMATQTKARVVLIGEAADAEIRVSDIELDWPHGTRFVIHAGDESRPVHTRLVGRHMVFPALAAIAVAYLEGRPLDEAIEKVSKVDPTPGRMQTMALPGGAFVIRDEFKGSEDSFLIALDAFAEIPAKRHVIVFGEISEDRGRQAYRGIAEKAGAFVDRAIFVTSSTHFEMYKVGAMKGGLSRDRITRVKHHDEATALLRDELQEGDAVLIKGRWQQALGRVGLALAGSDVQCRADPCPFKRMLCDVCPFLGQPFEGLPVRS